MENNDVLLGIAVFDKVRNQFLNFTFCNSKAEYIRQNVENIIVGCKNLNDVTPYLICEYNIKTGDIKPIKESFSWSEYSMPMSKAEALAPLGVDFAREALEYETWKKEKLEKSKNGGN